MSNFSFKIRYVYYCVVTLSLIVFIFIVVNLVIQNNYVWECLGDYNYIPSRPLYDIELRYRGLNYPTCLKLTELQDELMEYEKDPKIYLDHYKSLLAQGNLHCGRIRTKQSIFDLKYQFTTKYDCTSGIYTAKRHIYEYIKELCIVQNNSNTNHRNSISSKDNQIYSSIPYHVSTMDASSLSYGVIYTGRISHYRNIYQSILAHRKLQMNLRIEIWIMRYDYKFCKKTLGTLVNVYCLSFPKDIIKTKDATQYQQVFATKFYALLLTKLRHVIFMDADNIAIRNIHEIFESDIYEETGLVIWPDLCGYQCKSLKKSEYNTFDCGYVSYNTHVIWQTHIGGLIWNNSFHITQESDSGQLAIDLSRHAGLMDLGRKWIDEHEFLKKIVYGGNYIILSY